MNKKVVNYLILSILCISLLPVAGYYENRQCNPNAAYTESEPISIGSNEELAIFCSGNGSGTPEDPYIIENYSITRKSGGISISNTDAYLCIRNNCVNGSGNGIIINNARNVNVSGNIVLGTFWLIQVDSSQNIEISENTMTNIGTGTGLACRRSSYLDIKSNFIKGMQEGMAIDFVNSSQFSGNTLQDSSMGLILGEQRNNTYTNNVFIQSTFYLSCYKLDSVTIDTSNKVNGKPVRFYNWQTNISVSSELDNTGQFLLLGVNNSEFRGLTISNAGIAFMAKNCYYNTFSDNDFSNCTGGFFMMNCSSNSFTMNEFTFNQAAFALLYGSTNNTVAGNLFRNNSWGAVGLYDSENNRFYYNAFIANGMNVHTYAPEINIWDDGKKGNYWDNYTQTYPYASHNGKIWNTPYTVFQDGEILQQDRYPLAYIPFSQFDAPELSTTSDGVVDGVITLHWNSLLDAEYYLVYRSNSEITSVEGLTPIANTTATVYTDTVPEGTNYYVVIAVNEFKISGISNNVKVEGSNTIDGFPLAIIGIIGLTSLIVIRKRLETNL